MLARILALLRNLLRRKTVEQRLDEELRACVDILIDEKISQGIDPHEARRQASVEIGGIEQVKERVRDATMGSVIQGILQDVRYGLRSLAKKPAMTAVAVMSLAFGVGGVTAVYSTVDWLLNRPPGNVREPERLLTLWTTDKNHPELGPLNFSFPQYEVIKRIQDVFVDVAAYGKVPGVAANETQADQVVFEYVTGNYFSMLGVRPSLGRVISEEDDVAGAPAVAMLSYEFWLSRFGGDTGILNKPVRLSGQPTRIIGVGPKDFEGYNLDWNGPTSVWIAMHAPPPLGRRGLVTSNTTFFPVIGRLRAGVTPAIVEQRAQAWIAQLPKAPTGQFLATAILPSRSTDMRIAPNSRERAEGFLGMLLAVCCLILAAACFNISNFLLGNAVSHRSELALRIALGASRGRLAQQLLIEALLLGLSGALLGLLIAVEIARLLATMPRIYLNLPFTAAMLTTAGAIDFRMVGIAMALGLTSALAFGLLPALLASFRNPTEDLKNPKPHWTWCGVRFTARQALLLLQVSLSVALAVTSGLYARSFIKISRVDSGYAQPQSVLVARIVPSNQSTEQGIAFYRGLLARLNGMSEVLSASMGWNPPKKIGRSFFYVPGRESVTVQAGSTAASPRFFETHGVAVIGGREFEDSESDMRNGLIISQALAEKLYGKENPVGQPIMYGTERRNVTGVVAEDSCNDLLGEHVSCSWRPFPMSGSGYIRVRTKGAPMDFVPSLRRIVHELDPNVAVAEETSLDAWLNDLTGAQRNAAIASTALAFMGILLLAIGCVSLFASMVKDSLHEIAIRMALGSSNLSLTWRIVAQGLLISSGGIFIGTVGAWLIAQQIATQLYRTDSSDSLTFTVVPLLVLFIGLASVYWTARLATRTDPARCLRSE